MFSAWLDKALRRVFGTPIDGTGQKLTIGAAATTTSTAFAAGTTVRLNATVRCWVMFCDSSGDSAVVNGSDMLLSPDCPELFTCDDDNVYISCIEHNSNDGGGDLSIMPLSGYRVP